MSQTEKRISFKGVDSGFFSMADQVRKKNSEISRDVIRDAQQYSTSAKEQIRFVNEHIKALDRRAQLEKQLATQSAKRIYETQSKSKNPEVRALASKNFKEDLNEINKSFQEEVLQSKLIRELIDVIQSQSKDEILQNKKGIQEVIEEDKKLEKEGRVKEFDTPEERLKYDLQRQHLDKESEGEEGDKKGQGILGKSRDAMLQGLGIAAFLGPIGIIAKMIQEGSQLQESKGRLRAITGQEDSLDMGHNIGVKSSDFAEYRSNFSQAQGQNMSSFKVLDLLYILKGYGLTEGQLNPLVKQQQYESNGAGAALNFQKLLTATGYAGMKDQSKVPILLEQLVSLGQDQSSTLEKINTDTNAQVVAAFQSVGGSFADDRGGQRRQTIDNALKNPGNDYKQAFSYGILRKLKPSASLFELQEMQSRGVALPGYLEGAMSEISKMAGGDENTMLMMMKSYLGLSPEQTRQLLKGSKGGTAFSRIGREGVSGNIDIQGRAKDATGTIPILMSTLNDKAAQGGEWGLGKLKGWVDMFVGDEKPLGPGGTGPGGKVIKGDVGMNSDKFEAMNKAFDTAVGRMADRWDKGLKVQVTGTVMPNGYINLQGQSDVNQVKDGNQH